MSSKGKHFVDMYWLELGALRERERIIKLLEEHHDSFSWQHCNISQDNCHACTSIALIKGEDQ